MVETTTSNQMYQAYVERQDRQDLLRFITCGSVDDGKSTLIGRLLWEAGQLSDDQISGLERDSARFGTQGADIDFALLVDGLAAEREQGITIDVAYRYFATPSRKFIVADTPGHQQYTRNMVTGASTASVAILLIDASQGLQEQTHRHAHLVSLVGIRQVVLAINKMDKQGFDRSCFERIVSEFKAFSGDLRFTEITAMPISALRGDNIKDRSQNTPWYEGPTLLEYLETVPVRGEKNDRMVFPVQWVNRPNQDFRGFSGTIREGAIRVGDEIRVALSGQLAMIESIVTMGGNLEQAMEGQAVTLTLDREIDVSRGDILASAVKPVETTDQFEAYLVWMHEERGLVGRTYDLKLSTQWTQASLTLIKYRLNVVTGVHESVRDLSLNDIAVCNLALHRPLVAEHYDQSRTLGAFILVDRMTNATVAAGMVRHSLRRAQNVHRQALSVSRELRERQNGHRGKVVWFTGLSGAGKSTIANALELELHRSGYRTYLLDGDNVRQGLNRDLGFTEADRVENIRRLAEVAKLMMDAGLIVLTAFVSPFRREREMARELIGSEWFIEVYVDTPLEVCEQRDPKGLYKKARAGQLPNMTGIDSPYEAPMAPDIVVMFEAMLESTVKKIYNVIS